MNNLDFIIKYHGIKISDKTTTKTAIVSFCQQCPNSCCKNQPGVELTEHEQTYLFHNKGWLEINLEGHCYYLEKDGCSIYEVRPSVCREYSCKDIESGGVI